VPVAGGEINVAELARLIAHHRPTLAVIERVSAMPGQGVTSMFNFGRSYGDVRGTIGALGVSLCISSRRRSGKSILGCPRTRSNPGCVPSACFRLRPRVSNEEARRRAEAALIALYGAEVLDKGVGGGMKYTRHSPSSAQSLRGLSALFVLEKIMGHRQPGNAPMYRGTAVEDGVTHGLMNPAAPMDECSAVAFKKYDTITALMQDKRREEYRETIPGMVKSGS
jgi:crossover junction endodeoxyribonuclease RuvC